MLTVPCVAVLQKVDISPCSYNPLMNRQTLPESGRGEGGEDCTRMLGSHPAEFHSGWQAGLAGVWSPQLV